MLEKIKKIFPNENISVENDGWTSCAFTVGDNIVRIPKAGIELYEKEQKVTSFLRNKVSVQVPDIKVVHGEIDYSIHKKILGRGWNSDTYNKLSEKDKELFASDVASFFAQLHKIPVDEISKHIDNLENNDFLSRDEAYNFFKEEFTKTEIDKIYCYCFTHKFEDSKKDLVFTHQDFHPGNVLVDKNHRLKGVFDFCNSCLADRALDFCSLYSPKHQEFLRKVISHYEKITCVKISIDKIKDLNDIGIVYSLVYLARNPKLKASKKDYWDKKILKLKDLIRDEMIKI